MGDRDTLIKIQNIMRRLLLVTYDPVGPIPRKGTTRHECYRALWEIQELLHTNRYFAELPQTTNADVVPVRHGRWNDDGSCSVCGRCDWDNVESKYFLYCPNCGAQMDGGVDDA